jgi:hypothetical protein
MKIEEKNINVNIYFNILKKKNIYFNIKDTDYIKIKEKFMVRK